MLPNIIDSVVINELTVISLSNGTLCVGFEIPILDAESENIDAVESELISYLGQTSNSIRIRFILDSFASHNSEAHSRSQAINKIGYVDNRLYVFFEKDTNLLSLNFSSLKNFLKPSLFLEKEAKKFLTLFSTDGLKNIGCTLIPLSIDQYRTFLPNLDQQISNSSGCIHTGDKSLAIVKLIKQASHKISCLTFCQNKDSLSLPYRYVVTLTTEPALKTEKELRQNSNQAAAGNDAVAANNYLKTQNVMNKVISNGAKFIHVESQFILTRATESLAKQSAFDLINIMRPLGHFYLESVGSYDAWKSTLLGEYPHYPFKEIDEVVPSYLPIFTYGLSPLKRAFISSSLVLQRKDESLQGTSPFQEGYESYSACIIGLPGSGKSVLGNMITRALHYDESINIVKLDVGGSHNRETEMLGGIEYEFTIDKPGGFNPFSIINMAPKTKDLVQILATFLETLLREEQELFISKDLKADIEQSLQFYIDGKSESPSIDDFLNIAHDYIPRFKLLERWSSKGIYGNAFKETDNHVFSNNRLKYFNFSKISQALDGDFAQGGLASVMVAFNFDMLFNRNGRRFVFMADEVPVFIKRCFSFFDLSISNIRKYGDGFITIGQKTEHFIVEGKSLLEASPSKFIFTVDAKDDVFSDRLGIDLSDVDSVRNLRRVQNKYSEVFHIDNLGKRTYRIVLSPHEYWSYTSKKEDKDKIQNLLKAVPGLTIEEAIKCLSL
ncbi:MAG: TraG/VirB4 family ATPase [Bdellovibrio sp.]